MFFVILFSFCIYKCMFNLETLRLLSKLKKAPDFTAKFAGEAKGSAYFWLTDEGVIYLIDLRGLPINKYFDVAVHSRYAPASFSGSASRVGEGSDVISSPKTNPASSTSPHTAPSSSTTSFNNVSSSSIASSHDAPTFRTQNSNTPHSRTFTLPALYSNKGHGLGAGLVNFLTADNLLGASIHLKADSAHLTAPISKH